MKLFNEEEELEYFRSKNLQQYKSTGRMGWGWGQQAWAHGQSNGRYGNFYFDEYEYRKEKIHPPCTL